MSDLTSFIAQKRRWHSFTQADLEMAANGVILAADGKMSRADARMFARAALEGAGMEKAVTPNPSSPSHIPLMNKDEAQ